MFQASIFLASKLPCSGPLLPCLPGSWTLYATDNFYFLVGLGLAAAVIDKFTLYVTLYVPGTGVHGYITLGMSVAWVKPEVELRSHAVNAIWYPVVVLLTLLVLLNRLYFFHKIIRRLFLIKILISDLQ